MPEQWDVFHIVNCHHARPHPKNKYLLIAYVYPQIHGFFINSKINPFIKKSQHLLPCEAAIFCRHNLFLAHDSFVDCREVFSLERDELTDLRGRLDASGIRAVREAVRKCAVLEREHKARISSSQT